jgi:hypothetical protein
MIVKKSEALLCFLRAISLLEKEEEGCLEVLLEAMRIAI